MASVFYVLRATLTVILLLAGIIVLVLQYLQSSPAPTCHLPPAHSAQQTKQANSSAVEQQTYKPVMLLWFWPGNKRAIQDDLSNLPTSPRPKFQRWIWFNADSPNHTRRIEGIQSLFNLTLTYRKDSDIQVRRLLTFKNSDEEFVLPKKERLLCWFVDSDNLTTQSGEGYSYYRELINHMKVDVFHNSTKGENYFLTMSSCKFYLSFENSIHRDYITETFNSPLSVGTVPIVLGPPRRNYEDFAPGESFIHVNDFPTSLALAQFLLGLDKDQEAYMRYFHWRGYYTARLHLTEEKYEFAHAICQACRHVGIYKEYRVVPDLYKWFIL
ncbi:4-galactosyl-N-acetylglucosaminide 3-alpha-L-fucosyltransferase 9 isoform X2 [Pseudoliparis swirei]|uniref:4-galactosyl-N-acetylglucosaminide 3-alpha-L-fucosyltransferase 9 isoform X2 n=1 Tax=Pseudoliparis swirei TaxID=2059687 RepID=UPI0024BDA517|nr:4-galactosyl-N-acetylglucosaminide 3-alpha-L-fucosyltransferase 9 isoform X2 [Pseudoliparis swirei]